LTGWSVLVQAVGPDDAQEVDPNDDRFARFFELLRPYQGISGGGMVSWSTLLTVEASTAEEAAVSGNGIAREAARRVGLPDWPTLRLEVHEAEPSEAP
jgi:hypothetical protein